MKELLLGRVTPRRIDTAWIKDGQVAGQEDPSPVPLFLNEIAYTLN